MASRRSHRRIYFPLELGNPSPSPNLKSLPLPLWESLRLSKLKEIRFETRRERSYQRASKQQPGEVKVSEFQTCESRTTTITTKVESWLAEDFEWGLTCEMSSFLEFPHCNSTRSVKLLSIAV